MDLGDALQLLGEPQRPVLLPKRIEVDLHIIPPGGELRAVRLAELLAVDHDVCAAVLDRHADEAGSNEHVIGFLTRQAKAHTEHGIGRQVRLDRHVHGVPPGDLGRHLKGVGGRGGSHGPENGEQRNSHTRGALVLPDTDGQAPDCDGSGRSGKPPERQGTRGREQEAQRPRERLPPFLGQPLT